MYFHTYSLLCTHVALQAPFNSFLLLCKWISSLVIGFFPLSKRKVTFLFLLRSQGLNNIIHIDFDYKKEFIYWVDSTRPSGRKINRMRLNGSDLKVPNVLDNVAACHMAVREILNMIICIIKLYVIYYSLLYYYCCYIIHFNHRHIFWWGKNRSKLHKCLIFYHSADKCPLSLFIVNMIDFLCWGSTACLLSRNETRRSQISLTSLTIQWSAPA